MNGDSLYPGPNTQIVCFLLTTTTKPLVYDKIVYRVQILPTDQINQCTWHIIVGTLEWTLLYTNQRYMAQYVTHSTNYQRFNLDQSCTFH